MPAQPNSNPSYTETIMKFLPWKNEATPSYPLNRYIVRRNIAGFPFSERINSKDAESISAKLSNVLSQVFPNGIYFSAKSLSHNEMQLTFEHLFLANREPMNPEGGIFIDTESKMIALIHLEDHLTLFYHDNERSENSLEEKILEVDRQIQKIIPFAFSEQFGYITASVTHLGTAFSKEAIIHAPMTNFAGKHFDEDEQVIVHGLATEASVLHNLVIATNKYCLGLNEKNISEKIHNVGSTIYQAEEEAKKTLSDKEKEDCIDLVSKNFGQALYSKHLTFHDALSCASNLDLGISLGYIESENKTFFFDLFFSTRRAHLNVLYPNSDMPIEEKRALLMKEKMKDLKLCI